MMMETTELQGGVYGGAQMRRNMRADLTNEPGLVGAAAACVDAKRDATPVEGALQNLQKALAELEHAANSLIDPLQTVIQYDPRDLKAQTEKSIAGQTPQPAFSCKLEQILAARTTDVMSVTKRLHEIRSNIQL